MYHLKKKLNQNFGTFLFVEKYFLEKHFDNVLASFTLTAKYFDNVLVSFYFRCQTPSFF